jgi:hypothetical protein
MMLNVTLLSAINLIGMIMAKPATAAQKKRFERICSLGCCICGGIAQAHHTHTGAGGRRDHDKTIPLCIHHHTGPHGIHNSRKAFAATHGTEQELLDNTNARLAEIWKD